MNGTRRAERQLQSARLLSLTEQKVEDWKGGKMKKLIYLVLITAGMAATFNPAIAATLTIVPSSDTYVVGDSVQVDLVVSDLTAGGPPSVGEFDIDITFEPELDFLSLEFGTFLGNPDDSTETEASSDLFGPFLNLFERSGLTPSALDALQPPTFTLATITFEAVMQGLTNIEGDIYAFWDTFGDDLITAHGPVGGAEIAINPVPVPPALLLLASGIAGLAGLKRNLF
jgi:hypothetical protein